MRPTHDEDTSRRRTAGAGDGETVPGPLVLGLRDPRAVDASLVGAKAANLARCAAAGLPVLPGLVVTTAATFGWDIGAAVPDAVVDDLRRGFEAAGYVVTDPSVVRSSSTVEDAEQSSMAGRFRSELGVVGWDGIVGALRAVRDSPPTPGHHRDRTPAWPVLGHGQEDRDRGPH